jgi:hypothetical protein
MTYPDVQLEVEEGSAPVDLVAQGFDAATDRGGKCRRT